MTTASVSTMTSLEVFSDSDVKLYLFTLVVNERMIAYRVQVE
jgi:hypothetical protein